MEDKTTGVSVWSLLKCSDEVSSEGYGIVVGKGDVKTALPQLRHGRMPRARFDTATGELWILGSDMEGTGVNVERPYLLSFDDNGYASIVNSIDPYEMQQALCKALTYSIDGQEITFYAEGKELIKATNTIEDMGGFMDDAIYIGEQFSYGIEGFLIRGGKKVHPVREMLITGDFISLWNNLVATARDARPCMSKLIPTLAFKDVSFSA
jgi:hypothetical protein